MVKRSLVLICCVTLYIIGVSAQATKKVTGAYTYHAPENISLEEAKHIAVNRAKIAAISDTFGTLVTQNNSTMISNKNGQSDNWFFSIGSSEIKGEWIETTKDPTFDISYQQGMLVVSVELEGVIRKISNERLSISAKILRNGITSKYESDDFRNGDDMYLFFLLQRTVTLLHICMMKFLKVRYAYYHISTIPLDTNELKAVKNIYFLNKV